MIFATGGNFFGQLGIGGRERPNKYTPTVFGSINEEESIPAAEVHSIQCGAQFTVVVSNRGTVSMCGTLNGNVMPTLSPMNIPLPLKCQQVACGRKHIVILMEKHIVMSWGTGYFGQLGHGDDSSWNSPRMIGALEPRRLGSRVISVACGGSHSGALTDSGQVFMWGLNRGGQCAQHNRAKSDSILEPRPIDMDSTSNCPDLSSQQVTSLVCGRNHSALLTSTGRVYVWGEASFGRLGLVDVKKSQPFPKEIPTFKSIPVASLVSGDFHMLALTRSGQVYSWGYGVDGQTGHSTVLNVRTPRRVEFFDRMDVRSVHCSSTWSMVVTALGQLFCFGYGDGGWLGIRPPANPPVVEADSLTGTQATDMGDAFAHIQCFDSRHSVLSPQRVAFLSEWEVQRACGGAGHMVVTCTPRPRRSNPPNPNTTTTSTSATSTSASSSNNHSDSSSNNTSNHNSSSTLIGLSATRELSLKSIDSVAESIQSQESSALSTGIDSSSSSAPMYISPRLQNHSTSATSAAAGPKGVAVSSKYDTKPSSSSSSSHRNSSSGIDSEVQQLFSWCRHKKVTELSNALDAGANVNAVDSAGNTMLIVACQNGHYQICKMLLTHRADLNARNARGNTALHYCFNYGYDEIGMYLIESGADEFQTNNDGLTCYEGLTHADLELL
mmetsp:Transcript_19638/g.33350  ORF Transcript_19638/g.33350 Transcript_19638/m.33350 type:complete len:666 (-) Transcript_19638:1948-3945(-)